MATATPLLFDAQEADWFADPPAYDAFLPGGACELRFRPPPRRRLQLEDMPTVHGAVSAILGESGVAHHERFPTFTVSVDGMGVVTLILMSDEAAAVIANGRFPVVMGGGKRTIDVRPLSRMRAPVVFGRGPRLLRITAESPVVVRRSVRRTDGREGHRGAYHQTPTTENIGCAIGKQFEERLGFATGLGQRLEVVEMNTRGVKRFAGAALRTTWGWIGSIVVRANAPAEWLLRVAEALGLGGRTAYGFGRVRVERL